MIFYSCILVFCVFFFFKQKTAYEVRISDWSSDVCSSDLRHHEQARHQKDDEDHMRRLDPQHRRPQKTRPVHSALTLYPPRTRRSEERRVRQECVSRL